MTSLRPSGAASVVCAAVLAALPAGALQTGPQPPPAAGETIRITIDTADRIAPLRHIWAWFGYDEPNYTYMTDGRQLLSDLAALSPVPVYVRTHNLLTTGDGSPGLKWGSTNAYTEDSEGRPHYNWSIVDQIMDTYIERGMKPFVEIGFMPEALSTKPHPYRHDWKPGLPYNRIYTGWTHPPTNYDRWRELIYQWVRHSVDRYGRAEVERWYWEVWNEPDIGYWSGTQEEYHRLYDYAADGVKRALPSARVGGPHTTGPLGPRAQQYLRNFLEHCLRGTNHATGRTGSPLDFVAFHAKGSPRVVDGYVRMGISSHLRAISNGFDIVASFPELKDTPIVIGESDPEGCAACSVATNPENAYRNGTMYSSYTAAQLARTWQLADLHGVNLLGSVTWAFEFEDQPYFAGFRDLATNGIGKPVLNVFRMLGRMRGDRLGVRSTGAAPIEAMRDQGVRGAPDVNALATRDGGDVAVLVWNYHDDDLPAPPARVQLVLAGMPDGRPLVTHYRVDRDHGNAYETWKRMGSPQAPTEAERAALQRAADLAILEPARRVNVARGELAFDFVLPRQGVSLLELVY